MTTLNPGLLNLYRQQLRAARIRQGVTMPQLSHRTGLSESFLDHCERGTRNPSFATLRKWAGALRFDFENTVKCQVVGSNKSAECEIIKGEPGGADDAQPGPDTDPCLKGVGAVPYPRRPRVNAHCASAQSFERAS